MDNDDRQLRGLYLVYFSGVILLIYLWTGHAATIVLGLCVVPILGFGLPPFMNFVSKTFVSLIYGFGSEELSYENGFYEDDMDKAKRLVREGKWIGAIHAYRSIVQKAPEKAEPRFYLAQSYHRAGYLGLAVSEYKKIMDSRDQFGSNHAFVLESERIMTKLRGLLAAKRGNFT